MKSRSSVVFCGVAMARRIARSIGAKLQVGLVAAVADGRVRRDPMYAPMYARLRRTGTNRRDDPRFQAVSAWPRPLNAPGRIRTCDPRIRSPPLCYGTPVQARVQAKRGAPLQGFLTREDVSQTPTPRLPASRRLAGSKGILGRQRDLRAAPSLDSGTGKGPSARALLVTFVESVSLSSTSSRRCSVGSSYDLVGGASSYSRSGLSAVAMLPPGVRRGIRDFADSAAAHQGPFVSLLASRSAPT